MIESQEKFRSLLRSALSIFTLLAITGCSGPAKENPAAATRIAAEVTKADNDNDNDDPGDRGPVRSGIVNGGSDINIGGLTFAPGAPPGPLAGAEFFSTKTGSARLIFTEDDVTLVHAAGLEKSAYEFGPELLRIEIQSKQHGPVTYEILTSDSDVVMLKLADAGLEEKGWPLMLKGRVKKD